jgi:hypothetical protein
MKKDEFDMRDGAVALMVWILQRAIPVTAICLSRGVECTETISIPKLKDYLLTFRSHITAIWVCEDFGLPVVQIRELFTSDELLFPNVVDLANSAELLSTNDYTRLTNGMPNLKSVTIYSDFFTDEGLLCLGNNCPLLERVVIDSWMSSLTTEGMRTFLEVVNTRLREFRFASGLEHAVVHAAALHCPQLRILGAVKSGWIEDAMFSLVADCSLLHTLDIRDGYALSSATIRALARHGQLQSLRISEANNIFDPEMTELVRRCSNLTHLHITHCAGVTSATVLAVATHSVKLESLILVQTREGCIADDALHALAKGCPLLQTLVLSRSNRITDVGVIALVEGCRELRMLTLSSANLTDRALVVVAERCPGLTDLSLYACPQVTDIGLTALVHGCRKLFYLSICGSAITSVSVRAVATHRKCLRMLHLAHSTVEELCVPRELFPGRIDVANECYCLHPHYSHPL